MVGYWVGLFLFAFYGGKELRLFIVWWSKENCCVCFPLQKTHTVHLASAGFNPGLFVLFCWEGRQKGNWMVYVTWAEEEKFLVFYCCCCCCWKIMLSVLPVSKEVLSCAIIPFCQGRNKTGCPPALNPGIHTSISVDLFSETLSNGCPESRIQGNNGNEAIYF